MRSPRADEGMNITGVTGLTAAQKTTLTVLGAINFDAEVTTKKCAKDCNIFYD